MSYRGICKSQVTHANKEKTKMLPLREHFCYVVDCLLVRFLELKVQTGKRYFGVVGIRRPVRI